MNRNICKIFYNKSTYKSIPSVLAMLIGLGLGLFGYDDIARPLLIVGGATLATTLVKNVLINWLIENVIYDVGGGLNENGKTLLESTLGVSITAYLFISPQTVSTVIATITIIGLVIWAFLKYRPPSSLWGWVGLSVIILILLSFLFVTLVGLFAGIPYCFEIVIILLLILLLVAGLYRDYQKPDIPKL